MWIRIGAALLIFIALTAYVFFVPRALAPEETARVDLIGVWRAEDSKFMREFKADGVVVDAYEGSELAGEGRWILFTKHMPPIGYTGALDDGLYLGIGSPQSEMLYFKVTNIDARTLELAYLNRDGTLHFEKVQ